MPTQCQLHGLRQEEKNNGKTTRCVDMLMQPQHSPDSDCLLHISRVTEEQLNSWFLIFCQHAQMPELCRKNLRRKSLLFVYTSCASQTLRWSWDGQKKIIWMTLKRVVQIGCVSCCQSVVFPTFCPYSWNSQGSHWHQNQFLHQFHECRWAWSWCTSAACWPSPLESRYWRAGKFVLILWLCTMSYVIHVMSLPYM